MDKAIITMLANNLGTIGLENCIKDLATEYRVSYYEMSNIVARLLSKEDTSHMIFKGNSDINPKYIERRMKGGII